MTLSRLPLSYCTNVHPGRTLVEVERGLEEYTVPVQGNFGEPLAAGLWLAQPVVQELLGDQERRRRFLADFERLGLRCHSLNAFPYGDFHRSRVKEQVYLPDWSQPERLAYTEGCAEVLAALLPEGGEGSISTVPLGFKGFAQPVDFLERCAAQLQELARFLDRLHREIGRLIRLAIEPEPFCILETIGETIAFFRRLWDRCETAADLETVRRHLGICYDVCHQAVEFEDIARSVHDLAEAGVGINKLHLTAALQLDRPGDNAEGREALARYAEQRYLHQTIARTESGSRLRSVDLTPRLARQPPEEFLQAEAWRIHFHVPVDAEHLGPLGTTRPQLCEAIAAVAGLDYAPHLEVETYTWEVLPDRIPERRHEELIEGLTRELLATRKLLRAAAT